jgi:hypothetical protein
MDDPKAERRRQLAKKAWQEAFDRLCAAAGPAWPIGTSLLTPAIGASEHAANAATASYVERGKGNARDALKEWEGLMLKAIEAAKGKRGCDLCGEEKVVEVVDPDGQRSCGRCRSAKSVG